MALADNFHFKCSNGLSWLVNRDWEELGIVHGMTGVDLGLTKVTQHEKLKHLAKVVGVARILIPNQVHGATVVCVDSQSCGGEGDAIIAKRDSDEKIAVGVVTADCVPIIFWSRSHFGAVHAGWRGLAAGVISNALKQASCTDIKIVIGPCASVARYEVGHEVIEQLDRDAVFRRAGTKVFLDLVETAKAQIFKVAPKAEIATADICTISDSAFHSYRREGQGCGRNLSFIACHRNPE